MCSRRKNYQSAFVIKNNKTQGIIEDEIAETEPGKFKSLRYRHTYYQKEDFVLTKNEVLEFLAKELSIKRQDKKQPAF